MAPPIHPNTITAARLPLAPIAVGAMVLAHRNPEWMLAGTITAAVLALILELTDILDGKIAREYGVVSDFGKLFDPFCDAFSRYTLFLGLYAIGVADLWMVLVIFWRDSSISFLRSVAAVRGFVMAARRSGKIKAVVQGVGTQIIFGLLVLDLWVPGAAAYGWYVMALIAVVTGISWVDYFMGSQDLIRAAWNDDKQAGKVPADG